MCLILATRDYERGALSILTENQDKEKLKEDNSSWRQGKERGYSAGNSGLATSETESSTTRSRCLEARAREL